MRRLRAILLFATVAAIFAVSCSSEDESTWTRSSEGIQLTVLPASIPAVPGPVDVTVEVVDIDGGYATVFVSTCVEQHGQVAPPSSGFSCAPVEGVDSFTTVDPLPATPFSVALTVQIGESIIQDGGVTLVAGDIFVPYAGAVLLDVSG